MNKQEKFAKMHGWKKTKGYKIDKTQFEHDETYIREEDFSDFIEEVDFWYHDDLEESACEDIDEVLEQIEEIQGDKFE